MASAIGEAVNAVGAGITMAAVIGGTATITGHVGLSAVFRSDRFGIAHKQSQEPPASAGGLGDM